MAVQRMSLQWLDAVGGTRLTTLTTSAGAAAVATALVAKSNADVALDWEGTLQVALTPITTAAVYQSTRDAALLIFQLSTGDLVTITLPAPVASIFFADGTTVDPAQIAGIISNVTANVVDAAGNAVASFVGGARNANHAP